MKNEQSSGQKVAARRKHLMKAIGGGLFPEQQLELPTGEVVLYAGRYTIDTYSQQVRFSYYEKETDATLSLNRRKIPSTVSIENKTYSVSFEKTSRQEN